MKPPYDHATSTGISGRIERLIGHAVPAVVERHHTKALGKRAANLGVPAQLVLRPTVHEQDGRTVRMQTIRSEPRSPPPVDSLFGSGRSQFAGAAETTARRDVAEASASSTSASIRTAGRGLAGCAR